MKNLYSHSPDLSLFLEGLLAACISIEYVYALKLLVNLLVKFVQGMVWLCELTVLI